MTIADELSPGSSPDTLFWRDGRGLGWHEGLAFGFFGGDIVHARQPGAMKYSLAEAFYHVENGIFGRALSDTEAAASVLWMALMPKSHQWLAQYVGAVVDGSYNGGLIGNQKPWEGTPTHKLFLAMANGDQRFSPIVEGVARPPADWSAPGGLLGADDNWTSAGGEGMGSTEAMGSGRSALAPAGRAWIDRDAVAFWSPPGDGHLMRVQTALMRGADFAVQISPGKAFRMVSEYLEDGADVEADAPSEEEVRRMMALQHVMPDAKRALRAGDDTSPPHLGARAGYDTDAEYHAARRTSESVGPDQFADLVEGLASNLGHLTLDLVGLIPGAGEPADIANAVWYLSEDPPDHLFAALSLISVIPSVGDAVGKGGKVAIWAARALRNRPRAARAAAAAGGAVAKAGQAVRAARAAVASNATAIDSVLDAVEAQERLASLHPHVEPMRRALYQFARSA